MESCDSKESNKHKYNYVENLFFNQKEENLDIENSDISKFLSQKSVFLTGATGFLGKLLLEKLLYSCPNLKSIYILGRSKKGENINSRLDKIFNNIVFNRLRKKQPKFRDKIIPIQGDLTLDELGMNQEDLECLQKNVNIVIHCAATVNFNENLKTAVQINIVGTKSILYMAKTFYNLVSFVYVSTAYSHCPQEVIKEKFYPVPVNSEEIIQIMNEIKDDEIDYYTKRILKKWPNTYSFTKAIAEDTVQQYKNSLPICIFRPSIVISTYKEPTSSWIDNINGPTGVSVGIGCGILRCVLCQPNYITDVVPADYVVNGIIAACYNTAKEQSLDIPIYNFVSSSQNPITWEQFLNTVRRHAENVPAANAIWYPFILIYQNKLFYYITSLFLHFLPALFLDIISILMGKKARMIKLYKKINMFTITTSYFALRQWTFTNDNTKKLWNSISLTDKKIYPFNMGELSWDSYALLYFMGIRTYLLKEDTSTIPMAQKKYFIFNIIHKSLQILLLALVYKLIFKCLFN